MSLMNVCYSYFKGTGNPLASYPYLGQACAGRLNKHPTLWSANKEDLRLYV